ncbi:MAG: Ni/Fe hydrogenase [Verrucomicrobia bacterium]|nr:Ni/Fe hydrogenase [Verrucomicrobiota bacterium]
MQLLPRPTGTPPRAPKIRSAALRPTEILLLVLLILTVAADAHTVDSNAEGFVSGFKHPLRGPDHIVAMVAVGLWGAILEAPAVWLLPVVFPTVMAFGGALGVLGVPLLGIETGIAASGIVLGLAVLFASRPNLWKAALLVAVFGIFHGHAHGTELPGAANPLTYSIGFVVSTGLLHLGGIALGFLNRFPWGLRVIRGCGGFIACVGVGYLFHWL